MNDAPGSEPPLDTNSNSTATDSPTPGPNEDAPPASSDVDAAATNSYNNDLTGGNTTASMESDECVITTSTLFVTVTISAIEDNVDSTPTPTAVATPNDDDDDDDDDKEEEEEEDGRTIATAFQSHDLTHENLLMHLTAANSDFSPTRTAADSEEEESISFSATMIPFTSPTPIQTPLSTQVPTTRIFPTTSQTPQVTQTAASTTNVTLEELTGGSDVNLSSKSLLFVIHMMYLIL
jgi:hypothetical protein